MIFAILGRYTEEILKCFEILQNFLLRVGFLYFHGQKKDKIRVSVNFGHKVYYFGSKKAKAHKTHLVCQNMRIVFIVLGI